jgi:hypothetical protein
MAWFMHYVRQHVFPSSLNKHEKRQYEGVAYDWSRQTDQMRKRRRQTMQYEKHMIVALTVSAFIMMLNIIAVTSGVADSVYSPITNWLSTVL